ncbi:MAG: bifunctional phosphoribosylaminoimidazolecarboxamide formyltransferase/IMP cyclohydrolase [candidate division KSB1 bacterium]|nr:bifunctional phosphoribosylaminoimidazolecarboxamide formyltransferase/IMP cyclohydrolase [candidate division KSB1 bacterium]MDZ7368507.1 bifunctional phosphoribosylaminoimidazolecarboxamide formyltransferase/IMP cyclohydrolase [candidate division KSB1 bacterium]MDZ7406265.1 bifunctional phosphoribosylaminoimidazolecarboxamide formyltransferase/IMP cyclohydrolase [candidate division KSB1 bacterium]
MSQIHRALISVHDKTGLHELAKFLAARKIEIVSTGGTARFLKEQGIAVTPIEQITGFPEILDGRVKTLHPKIFGGLLARREVLAHLEQSQSHGIGLIDLVIVNLYPFREVVAKPDVALAEAIENIDIGGVALIRAAAKNFAHVGVVTSPAQYAGVIAEMEQTGGELSEATRRELALAAFAHTAQYDAAINAYLQGEIATDKLPASFSMTLEKIQDLRYGENPHQRAAFYRDSLSRDRGIAGASQWQGKELSYNNIADADAALAIVRSFAEPCAVIIKHANPCGVATGATLVEAYQNAKATDPVSAFGGIISFNREVDGETAAAVAELFAEVILAPGFNLEAQRILASKKNLRLLTLSDFQETWTSLEFKKVAGGMLVQDQDMRDDDEKLFKVVTKRQPTAAEWAALRFGWKVVRYVKSNAIVYCAADRTIGIGAGQMSRVDASLLAIEKAQRAGLSIKGTAMASDAFFPFPDGVEAAAQAGATAVIQPGGSVRDAEVIAAADRHNLAMVFTGVRHFRH